MADNNTTCAEEVLDCLWRFHIDHQQLAANYAIDYVRTNDAKSKANAEKYLASSDAFATARQTVISYLPGIIQQAKESAQPSGQEGGNSG